MTEDKKKLLLEVMDDYAAAREPKECARNHAVFLVYRDAIMELCRVGWNLMDVWRAMHKKGLIKFSYSSFRRYARRFAKNDGEVIAAPPVGQAVSRMSPTVAPQPGRINPGQPGGVSQARPTGPSIGRVEIPTLHSNRKPRDPNGI